NWTDSEANTVMKVPIGGGATTTLFAGQWGEANAIALDSNSVYWNGAVYRTGYWDETVMKLPVGGGSPVTLSSGLSLLWGIAVDSTNLYWTSFLSGSDGVVMKIPKAGGAPSTLAWGQTY